LPNGRGAIDRVLDQTVFLCVLSIADHVFPSAPSIVQYFKHLTRQAYVENDFRKSDSPVVTHQRGLRVGNMTFALIPRSDRMSFFRQRELCVATVISCLVTEVFRSLSVSPASGSRKVSYPLNAVGTWY
jgi:hypothetical protein